MSKQYIGGQLMYNDDYSTTETKTGARWIDGKPIYRKVYTGTMPSSWTSPFRGEVQFDLPANIDKTISAKGALYYSTNSVIPVPFTFTSSSGVLQESFSIYVSSVVRFCFGLTGTGESYKGAPIMVILEYTKTID